jgi:hypothetical protein
MTFDLPMESQRVPHLAFREEPICSLVPRDGLMTDSCGSTVAFPLPPSASRPSAALASRSRDKHDQLTARETRSGGRHAGDQGDRMLDSLEVVPARDIPSALAFV